MTPRQPLFDVIIPSYEATIWLDFCVRALEGFTQNPIRVVIVDGNSQTPDAVKTLKEIEDRPPSGPITEYRIVRLAENKSFSNACNAGVAATKTNPAPNIVILNNDALVQTGWDTNFLTDLADKAVGLAGARCNAISGLQSDSSGANNLGIEPKYLIFVCVAMRREVYDTVGPLDETTFDGWSCEDLDYSWLVKKSGGRLKISNAYVFHGFSQTLRKTVLSGQTRANYEQKYQARLVDKWGIDHVKKCTKILPKVMLATFAAEEWTRVRFAEQLLGMRMGTAFNIDFAYVTRLPIHMARQTICETVLKHEFDYLVMVDDDMIVPKDLIHRFLGHLEGPRKPDVVTALAYGRKPPYTTCVYSLGDDKIHGNEMVGIENTGLRKVDISGFAVSCIRVEALRRLKEKGVKTFFQFDVNVGEDFYFSHRLHENGIDLYCDTDLIVGHIGDPVVVDEAFKKAWKTQAGK